jgi:hypothetical protein
VNLSGSILPSPDPLYDPGTGNLEVYALGTGNALHEIYWIPAKRHWSGWVNLRGSITGV